MNVQHTPIDHTEDARHAFVIQALAEEIGLPVTRVKAVYEEVFEGMNADAKIVDYLPMLVGRRARQILRTEARTLHS
jgi:hypothetical protein